MISALTSSGERMVFGPRRGRGEGRLLDAAVPLPNALAAHAAIRGSRLVTVDQRVHTPLLSGQAGARMTSVVTGCLLTGRLPSSDVSC